MFDSILASGELQVSQRHAENLEWTTAPLAALLTITRADRLIRRFTFKSDCATQATLFKLNGRRHLTSQYLLKQDGFPNRQPCDSTTGTYSEHSYSASVQVKSPVRVFIDSIFAHSDIQGTAKAEWTVKKARPAGKLQMLPVQTRIWLAQTCFLHKTDCSLANASVIVCGKKSPISSLTLNRVTAPPKICRQMQILRGRPADENVACLSFR